MSPALEVLETVGGGRRRRTRGARPEKQIQDAILAWLLTKGFLAWHIPNRGLWDEGQRRYKITDKWFVPGIPDLEVLLPGGVTVRIEVKSAEGRLTDAQQTIINALTTLGHPAFVARSLEDVQAFFKAKGYLRS